MRKYKGYYFMENKNWYTHDEDTWDLILTDKAPEEAKESYEEFLKDNEYMIKLTTGLIDDEEFEERKYEKEFDNMTIAEAKKALEEFRKSIKANGIEDEEEIDNQIIATLGGMFIEDEINVNQLDELLGLVGEGYHLPDEFLAMSTEEQKRNFFEDDIDF